MQRILIAAAIVATSLSACHFGGGHRIKGNGTIKTENRTTASFNRVDVSGNIQVFVKQDSTRSVRIEADENLMSHIIIRTEDDELIIEPRDGENLSGSKSIKVFVSSPVFRSLEASGASGITSDNQLSTETMSIDISGASNANLDLNTPKVSAELDGASHITLKGKTKDLDIEGSGASQAKCFGLLSENADVDVSGASSAEVFASLNLKADASGASHIKYKGAANYTGSSNGASGISKVD